MVEKEGIKLKKKKPAKEEKIDRNCTEKICFFGGSIVKVVGPWVQLVLLFCLSHLQFLGTAHLIGARPNISKYFSWHFESIS